MADSDINKILELKSIFDVKSPRSHVESCSHECRKLWSLWESLIVRNGILCYVYESEGENTEKIVLLAPKEVIAKILSELHNKRTAGHLGRDKTIKSVKRRFYWPGMSQDIAVWCNESNSCARAKPGPRIGRAPLQQSVVGSPFDGIGIDIMNNEYQ